MLNGIIVDGNEYDMVASVKRTAKITQSDASGMMLDKHYHNDIIATYFEYDVDLVVPVGKEYEYTVLYNILTSPVSEHDFILPYNQGWLKLKARVEQVKDEYYKDEIRTDGQDPVRVWRKTSFSIIATEPSR